MKLNAKRTVFVGFAFFLICAFWQAYDSIVPKILTDKFGLPQSVSGVIMAMDNVLALFLLPFFGALSDKCRSRMGRRTPFIIVGTIAAALALLLLSVPDRMQLNRLSDISATDGEAYTEALGTLWDKNPDVRIADAREEGETATLNPFRREDSRPLQELISREAFTQIRPTRADGTADPDYAGLVIPARQAYASSVTAQNALPLIFFIAVLLVLLVSMGIFRSPAVALMPDVTPKPMRSAANAVINLMGSLGGVSVLLLGILLGTGKAENALMNYTLFFAVIAGIMLLSLTAFLCLVREPRWAAELQDAERAGSAGSKEQPAPEASGAAPAPERGLSRGERASLLLILFSVVLWYMGYNAVTSKYSVYAGSVLNMDYNTTLLIANGAAILSYLPIGFLSSKLGRRRMILCGVVVLTGSFFTASFLRAGSPTALMNLLFATAGIGWATINVNSYPMVVELSRNGNVGRYTGFYYTASMAAQVVTPILSGLFLDIRLTTLFPYATVFVAGAFITMLFVRHGDAKPDMAETVLDGLGGGD